VITQEQLTHQIDNLAMCKNLHELDFAQKEVYRQIDLASTINNMTKTSLKKTLQTKASNSEMNFIRNIIAKLNNFDSRTQMRIHGLFGIDWMNLRSIENDVIGVGSELSWLEKDLFNLSFASAKNTLFEIQKKKNNLVAMINAKKAEFEEDEKREKKKKELAEREKKMREEEERRRREEEERRRRMQQAQGQNPRGGSGGLLGRIMGRI
jgi:hypothetical protein